MAPAIKRLKLTEYNPKDKKKEEKFRKLGEKMIKINEACENYHKGITRKLSRRKKLLFRASK